MAFGTTPKRFELQGGGTHRQTDKWNSKKYIVAVHRVVGESR